MSIILINNFSPASLFTVKIAVGTAAAAVLPSTSSVVVTLNTAFVLTFSANQSSAASGFSIPPQSYQFGSQPICESIYYSLPAYATDVVFAYFMYNPSEGTASLSPNTLNASLFFNSFGMPGFYHNNNNALVPAIPFQITSSKSSNAFTVHFDTDTITGNQVVNTSTYPTSWKPNSGDLPGPFDGTLTKWSGVAKVPGGLNAIITQQSTGSTLGKLYYVTTLFYNIGTASIVQQAAATAPSFVSIPGILSPAPNFSISFGPGLPTFYYDATFPFVNTTASTDTSVCSQSTIYGCGTSASYCKVYDTLAGVAYCNPTALRGSLHSATPSPWSISVYNGTSASATVDVGSGNSKSVILAPGQPMTVTGFSSLTNVQILTSNTLPLSIFVYSGQYPTTYPLLLKYTDSCVQYAAVTTWYNPDRYMLYVYIIPQVPGSGYYPLYAFITDVSNLYPAYFSGGSDAITPGRVFTINNLHCDASNLLLSTSSSTKPVTKFTFLTSPDTGMSMLALLPSGNGGEPSYFSKSSTFASYNKTTVATVGVISAGLTTTTGLSTGCIIVRLSSQNTGQVHYMQFKANQKVAEYSSLPEATRTPNTLTATADTVVKDLFNKTLAAPPPQPTPFAGAPPSGGGTSGGINVPPAAPPKEKTEVTSRTPKWLLPVAISAGAVLLIIVISIAIWKFSTLTKQ